MYKVGNYPYFTVDEIEVLRDQRVVRGHIISSSRIWTQATASLVVSSRNTETVSDELVFSSYNVVK